MILARTETLNRRGQKVFVNAEIKEAEKGLSGKELINVFNKSIYLRLIDLITIKEKQ